MSFMNYPGQKQTFKSYQNLPLTYQKQRKLEESEKRFQKDSLRLNVINKDDRSQKISIIVKSSLLISHLKRRIQNQFTEIQNVQFLIRVIQDQNSFIFSNSSPIGQYVQNGQTIYIQVQKDKRGNNMNLPSNVSDLFLTLRYVSVSIIKKLTNCQIELSPTDIISQLLHLGYWRSNTQIIISLLKLLSKTVQNKWLQFDRQQNQVKSESLLKFMEFWFFQVQNSNEIYQDVFIQIINLLERLIQSQSFKICLKSNKIVRVIVQQSKNPNQPFQLKKTCLNIIKNINKKGPSMSNLKSNQKLQYVPTILQGSYYQQNNLQEVLDMLCQQSQDSSSQQKAIEILGRINNKFIIQSSIRLQFYWKLFIGLLKYKKSTQKKFFILYGLIFKQLIANTSISRCIQLSNKSFLKFVHQYLLEASPDMHKYVLHLTKHIVQESSKKGQLNISQTVQFINSPFKQLQIIICQALSKNNINLPKNSSSYTCYLPYIKDFIKAILKTDCQIISKSLLKIISMICIDQQCRYQIINLKGVQVFIKCLLQSYTNKNIQSQRACGKGLLNLAVSSKQIKTKILSQMQKIIQLYYKNSFDSTTQGYIQTILKPNKN